MSKQLILGCAYHWWLDDTLPVLTSKGQIIQQSQGDPASTLADPALPAAEVHNKNIPELVRQRLLIEFAHLFWQG